MKSRKFRSLAVSASILLLAAACSSGDKNTVELATPWLGPLNGFERVSGEDDSGVFVKAAPGKTEQFERGIFAPPEIIVSANSDLEAISPESYEKIKALFLEVFRAELAKQLPVANTAGERADASHLVHAALTNVTVTRKDDNPNAVEIGDLQFSFEGSTIEAEIRTRKTNARLAAFVVPAKAVKTGWDGLRAPFTELARRAAAEAAKARGAIDSKAAQPAPAAGTKPVEAPAGQ